MVFSIFTYSKVMLPSPQCNYRKLLSPKGTPSPLPSIRFLKNNYLGTNGLKRFFSLDD